MPAEPGDDGHAHQEDEQPEVGQCPLHHDRGELARWHEGPREEKQRENDVEPCKGDGKHAEPAHKRRTRSSQAAGTLDKEDDRGKQDEHGQRPIHIMPPS
jgi:hypothetical protein